MLLLLSNPTIIELFSNGFGSQEAPKAHGEEEA